jgi:hypothetical protein
MLAVLSVVVFSVFLSRVPLLLAMFDQYPNWGVGPSDLVSGLSFPVQKENWIPAFLHIIFGKNIGKACVFEL